MVTRAWFLGVDKVGSMTYPNNVGYKGGGASKEAAQKVDKGAKNELQGLIVQYLLQHMEGINPDAFPHQSGNSVHSVRSRFSELAAKGLIYKTERRGKSFTGMSQHIYIHPKHSWNYNDDGLASFV